MTDKCPSHDHCFDRIHDQLTTMRSEQHGGIGEIKEMLHEGAIRHERFEMQFTAHEKEIRQLQANVAELKASPKGVDWRGHVVRIGFSLAEKTILIICGAAAWAVFNGYLAK